MITKESLTALLEEHEQELKASILKQLEVQIIQDVQWTLKGEIASIVKEWIAGEIGPEIRAALVESKPAVLAAVALSATRIGEAMADALVADVTKNLSESYKRSAILKALIG